MIRSIKCLLAVTSLSACAASVPAFAQTAAPQASSNLTLEQQTSLRCAAAFAIVSNGQAIGNADALKYPELNARGREFFVRSSARIMDQTGMTRNEVAAALQAEAQKLWDAGAIEQVMPSCMILLDASGV